MKQTPINPEKIRGKFQPKKENTDITADPIDNPPEKSFKKDLPKSTAHFEQKQKDTRPIDIPALWASLALTIGAGIIPSVANNLLTIKQGSGALQAILQLILALAALIFNLKNTHLQEKPFPILGFNPLHLVTIVNLYLILTAILDIFGWLLNAPNLI